MRGDSRPFFDGLTSALLVRAGFSDYLQTIKNSNNQDISLHRYAIVHSEMLLQICRDYNSIGDYRILKASEIRYFYDGLRNELISATKSKG